MFPALRDMARSARLRRRGAAKMPEPGHNLQLPKGPPGEDTVVQQFYLPTVHTTKLLAFDAVREDELNAEVPDTNGAVGSTQFVEITNFDYAVYDKATGENLLPPLPPTPYSQASAGSVRTRLPAIRW